MSSKPVTNEISASLGPPEFPPFRHHVQFYEDDAVLVEGLSRTVGTALALGEAAIVIATEPHRIGLENCLRSRGVDSSVAVAQGRYIVADAGELLSRFMVGDSPDENLFREAVVPLLEKCATDANGKKRHVVAFGEMVAILWGEGNGEAAVRLEQLWNRLSEHYSFTLNCAYSITGFRHESDADVLRQICDEHSDVTPGESYMSLEQEDARLRLVAALQQKAQALETEAAAKKKAQLLLEKS